MKTSVKKIIGLGYQLGWQHLQNLDDDVDINRTSETIREHVQISTKRV
jgi:hypothetical protein